MSLLSFRAPVLYAACHRCGNALTHGEDECPHCGTNQSRALRTLGTANPVDYGSNVVLMPGRMLVPYPSVPDELDTKMNIARERKRVLKRVAFYLASGGMLALALGLAHAPALRSPAVQRLAALPEPAARKTAVVPLVPLVPVVPGNRTDLGAAASATVLAAASTTSTPKLLPVPAPQAIAAEKPTQAKPAIPPAVSISATVLAARTTPDQASQPVAPGTGKQALPGKPSTIVAAVAPPAATAVKPIAPSTATVASSTATNTTANQTADVNPPVYETAAKYSLAALATVEAQAHAFNDAVADNYKKVLALVASTIHPDAAPDATLASNPDSATPQDTTSPTPSPSKPADVAIAAAPAPEITSAKTVAAPVINVPDIPAPKDAVTTATVATMAAPGPTATADVPIASHAPQPSALTENGLPRMSTTPISPAMTAERPPAGSPGETLYIARLALLTNDLSAARKNLAEVPSTLSDDVEAKRIREELAQRESARDTAMQRARACDAASSWRCARRYAKEAIAIDASYPDSRVLLKRVNFKAAQAKKAADAAALLAANNAAHPPVHSAPIREAVAVPAVLHAVTPNSAPQNTYATPPSASSSSASNSAPHLFAAPAARVPHESHVVHEARDMRETRPIVETREPVIMLSPAKTPGPEESESRVFGGGVPIRPPGRGEAH